MCLVDVDVSLQVASRCVCGLLNIAMYDYSSRVLQDWVTDCEMGLCILLIAHWGTHQVIMQYIVCYLLGYNCGCISADPSCHCISIAPLFPCGSDWGISRMAPVLHICVLHRSASKPIATVFTTLHSTHNQFVSHIRIGTCYMVSIVECSSC